MLGQIAQRLCRQWFLRLVGCFFFLVAAWTVGLMVHEFEAITAWAEYDGKAQWWEYYEVAHALALTLWFALSGIVLLIVAEFAAPLRRLLTEHDSSNG